MPIGCETVRGGPRSIGTWTRARTFERKKRRVRRVLRMEERSSLRSFFTGGVEYDDGIDPAQIESFVGDFDAFQEALEVSSSWGQGVELKFRRLGRHRAEGLYYPDQRVLVMALSSWRSFAHEFGHLVDYRGGGHRALSGLGGFSPFHDTLLWRMRGEGRGDYRLGQGRGRISWRYFSSRAECFARAFEQYASELLPQPSCLVGRPERYRQDPLFFGELSMDIRRYFRQILLDGPAAAAASVTDACACRPATRQCQYQIVETLLEAWRCARQNP